MSFTFLLETNSLVPSLSTTIIWPVSLKSKHFICLLFTIQAFEILMKFELKFSTSWKITQFCVFHYQIIVFNEFLMHFSSLKVYILHFFTFLSFAVISNPLPVFITKNPNIKRNSKQKYASQSQSHFHRCGKYSLAFPWGKRSFAVDERSRRSRRTFCGSVIFIDRRSWNDKVSAHVNNHLGRGNHYVTRAHSTECTTKTQQKVFIF